MAEIFGFQFKEQDYVTLDIAMSEVSDSIKCIKDSFDAEKELFTASTDDMLKVCLNEVMGAISSDIEATYVCINESSYLMNEYKIEIVNLEESLETNAGIGK